MRAKATRISAAVLLTAILCVGQVVFASTPSKPLFTEGFVDQQNIIDLSPSIRAPQDTCSLPFLGSQGFVVDGWLTGDETYLRYQDPASSSCGVSNPFGLTGARFVICFQQPCTTDVVFHVYNSTGGACPQPGAPIYSSPLVTLQAAGMPGCALVTVNFPDTVCLYGPFFLGYEFVDSVNCFQLFTDTIPGPCISYDITGDTLVDLYDPGFPGNLWVQGIGLDSAQSGCPPQLDSLYNITELYDELPAIEGQEVRVLASYTNPTDGKIVDTYLDYMLNELMPRHSVAFLDGLTPDSDYWDGGVMIITGTVSVSSNPYPVYGDDTLFITLTATSFDYKLPGGYFPSPGQTIILETHPEDGTYERDAAECDPCKFAILISGGGDAANNKQGFWEDLEELYKYKTDPTGGNYCPENVKVLYYDGNSGDAAAIPDSLVDPCTEANVQAAHDEIARKIAECERQGKDATVQKFVSNHGEDNTGIVTLGTERISPEELRNMQQALIDSCCDYMFDEFTQCYGGDMVNGLKGLDDKGKTEIHANSAAPDNGVALGDPNTGSAYLKEKVRLLRLGKDYEDAVKGAKDVYKAYLDSVTAEAESLLKRVCDIVDALPPGDPDLPEWERLKTRIEQLVERLRTSQQGGSPSFVSFPFKEYCDWKRVVMPTNGQIKLRFSGTGGCGNVTVYCEQPDGTKVRYRVWNWNLPGSSGYTAGNNTRVFNGDPSSNGVYWIHNDNGAYTVRAESCPNRDLPETPSNIPEYAGFSLGGTDGTNAEFGNIVAPTHTTIDTEIIGLQLTSVPGVIGMCGGVGSYQATFNVTAPNPWWSDMFLWLNVTNVLQPGILEIQVSNAEIPFQTLPITEPGIYIAPLGAMEAPSSGQIIFNSLTGNVCFAWDCWALRSNVPTFEEPEYICGDADASGLVTISDAVYLINYIFAGGPPPMPLLSGDADCNGLVTISDAVYLINFIFGGGPPPCADCK